MREPKKSGYFVSKGFVVITLIVFAAILLTVSLLIGLLTRKQVIEKTIYVQTQVATQPTTKPSTQPPTITTPDPYGVGPWQADRLPDGIIPHHYDVLIKDIDTRTATYGGISAINFTLSKPLEYLLVHIKFITVIKVDLHDSNGEKLPIRSNFTYEPKQYFVLRAFETLKASEYTIKIEFRGFTNRGIVGMYQSSYVEDGQEKIIISTKFEPTDARKAFPCFDEPALKATYKMSIEHDSNTIALSNFPIEKTELIEGAKNRTSFETTFKMSTYLLAWVIAPNDFTFVEDFTSDIPPKPIRVYARKAAVQRGLVDYALEVTKKSLEYFQNIYFNISEAVPPKIDMVAIPNFVSGAMEHWGLVGFRETRLLFSEKDNSVATKQSVTTTIVHEIAHFWFGNYVTCAWWNDLWLNEAMATFLQFKAMEKFVSIDMDMGSQFLIEETLPVLFDDGYASSHPIEANVVTPDQINNVFDSITYNKGAAVLKQLESVVGEDDFQRGLQIYLRENAFGPGEAADFYRTLNMPADIKNKTNPQEFMGYWLKQMNYPIIKINLEHSSARKTKIFFEQKRFLLAEDTNPTPSYVSPYNYLWQVYFKCTAGGTSNTSLGETQHTTGNEVDFTYFLDKSTGSFELPEERQFTWVKCNNDFKSFYMTEYSDDIYKNLVSALKLNNKLFSTLDRANLLHVSYQLAYLGKRSYSIPAYLNDHLAKVEDEYVPWRVFYSHVSRIAALLETRSIFEQLSKFTIKITSRMTSSLDLWSDTGAHLEKRLKATLIDLSCRMQDRNCLKEATKSYEKLDLAYFDEPNKQENAISANIRLSTYRYHIQNTYDYNDWFNLFKVYEKSSDPQEQSNVLSALSYSKSNWILNKYLQDLLSPNASVKSQDFFTVVNAISRNPSGRYLAWYFMRQRWDEIVAKFGIQDRLFGRSLKTVCELFDSEFLYNEMIDFFNLKPNAGAGEANREQAKDIVKSNIKWIVDKEQDLKFNLLRS